MSDNRERQIFLSALDLKTECEQRDYLARVCGEDHSLRLAVDELLAAYQQSQHVLDHTPAPCLELRRKVDDVLTVLEGNPTASREVVGESSDEKRLGEIVGNYRLLQKIGEGGFGQVYVAEQIQPIRRQVAVKLLKPSMNSKEILARFDAERQALAIMDHPHIAKVFDAGTTSNGQPFFAMELVHGIPITEYCKQNQLSIRDRLKLFIDVCHAVQHAHQKGIIHRDLKPSNVMVTLHDELPVVKVIDFGVAKAIGEPLTEHTYHTRVAQLLGTPMYMSPEQAEMNPTEVDVRSDVYSLGMLFYELLTGSPPYNERRLFTANFDELRKIIREEELPPPSRRLSSIGRSASTMVFQGIGTSIRVSGNLRGDLDCIVMKAVDKDRSRRYESAAALALDIQRYLNQEPIQARPPSIWYRFIKYVRRNKAILSVTSSMILVMMLGTGIAVWQANLAIAERDEKELARREADEAQQKLAGFADRLKEANTLFASGRAHADAGLWSNAFTDYTRATEIEPNYYHVWVERGAFELRLGLWTMAANDYAKALQLQAPISGAEWWGVPQLLLLAGNETAYFSACQELLKQVESEEEIPSIAAIRSSVFADQTIISPSLLADWVEQSLSSMNDSNRDEGPHEDGNPKFPPRKNFPSGPRPSMHGPPGPPPDDQHGPPHSHPEKHAHAGPHPPIGGSMHHDNPPFLSQPYGATLYVAGLAHYRAGAYERAIERFEQSLEENLDWQAREISLPALAMAYLRNGQVEQAKETLKQATTAIDHWTELLENASHGETPIPWFDWIEYRLLYREATREINGGEPEIEPRLQEIEARALSEIR